MKASSRARSSSKKPAAKSKPKGPSVSKREIGPIRTKLLTIREDLLKKVRNKPDVQVTADVGDEADVASQSIEKELMFELSDNERLMLDQTEAALRKIDNGTYGICESCRTPIARERIRALPFARYCIACQSRLEVIPR